jgi:hypothetical protein
MGQLEPDDSRNVTLNDQRAPGEPPRTGPREGETRGQQQRQDGELQSQSQSQESDWRAAEATRDRDAQDHEFAGDIDSAPSLRPDADDGQWSQQPAHDSTYTQSQQGEPDIRPEAELRGPRDSMGKPEDAAQRRQAERGGG